MNIALLISGGVDSTVALHLLKQAGHNVTAFYLKIWLEDELSYLGNCPWEDDLAVVRAVCEQAGVPLEVVSFQREYWDTVVAYTIAEIKAGRTPNPDMLCNQEVKFGAFYEKFGKNFDKIATGHYAQIRDYNGYPALYESPDPIKDQTYFLARMSTEQRAHALFPIGHLPKAEVRKLAEQFDVPNKSRKDSQGICFLGKLKFSDFVAHYIGKQEGSLIEHETGKKIGSHSGAWFYTIGQRQGIGLSGGPWYVVAKDHVKNTVSISREYYSPEKARNELIIENIIWQAEPEVLTHAQVKLRHGPHKHEAKIEHLGNGRLKITLDDQDQGIASGQFAVLYDGPRCILSGVIV